MYVVLYGTSPDLLKCSRDRTFVYIILSLTILQYLLGLYIRGMYVCVRKEYMMERRTHGIKDGGEIP